MSDTREKLQESETAKSDKPSSSRTVESNQASPVPPAASTATTSTAKLPPPAPRQKIPTADEKRAALLAQRKSFEDRFKKRGKRPLPAASTDQASKKPKPPSSAYEQEVAKYESRMLKDSGSGVRAIMK